MKALEKLTTTFSKEEREELAREITYKFPFHFSTISSAWSGDVPRIITAHACEDIVKKVLLGAAHDK